MTKEELVILCNIISKNLDSLEEKELKIYKKLKLMVEINEKQSEIDELVKKLQKKDEE